jgi:hypothetical protein
LYEIIKFEKKRFSFIRVSTKTSTKKGDAPMKMEITVKEAPKLREKDLPSAVTCMENSLNSCLTCLQFFQEEWVYLSEFALDADMNSQ